MRKLYFSVGIILASTGIALAGDGEAVMSDQEFFQALNFSLPALKSVKEAVDQKDYPEARAELIKYFRSKTTAGNVPPKKTKSKKSVDTTIADKVRKHIFTRSMGSYFLGKRVDWLARVAKNKEFTVGINRHASGSLGSLARAYRETGDEKYAQSFAELITAWITDVGLPKPGNERQICPWRSLTSGLRLTSWMDLWRTFQESPNFTEETKIFMLKSMLVHGRWVSSPKCRGGGNWVFMIANGLASLGIVFPEFKESDKWVEVAFGRAAEQYQKQIYPDSMQQELSPHYHWVSVAGLKISVELAMKHKRKLPPCIRKTQERMLEATMYLSMPDGVNPPVNDADLLNMRRTLSSAAKWYQRADMKYVGSGYTKGVRPKHISYGLSYAGLYTMRSGWDSKARYLLFDAGPFGAGHTHEDALNIIVHAYGKTLLFDSSNDRDAYKHTPFRWYQLKTESHNTIMVDGLGQCRIRDKKARVTSQPLRNRWVSAPGFDYAEGSYTGGYCNTSRIGGRSEVKAVHRRKIFFLKPDYWIVCDTVTGKGKHKVESLWHFTPGEMSIDNKAKSARTQNANANLLIMPADPANLSLRIVKGRKKKKDNVPPDLPDAEFGTYDVQGWGAFGQGTAAVPTPTAIYASETALPYNAEMILYPYPTKQPPSLSVTKLRVEKKGKEVPSADAVGLKVTREGETDCLLISHEKAGCKLYGDIEFDGKVACLRETGEGRIKSMSIVDGKRLAQKQRTLIESSGILDALDVQFAKNILKISLSNPHQVEKLSIYAPKITAVELNGVAVSFKRNGDSISVTPVHLDNVTTAREKKDDNEKIIIASFRDGRVYSEFTGKAGICIEVPAAASPGQSLSVKVTFYNISLPRKAKVKVNLSLPFIPGQKSPSQAKISDSPWVFDAPHEGGKLTRTFRVKLIMTKLADAVRDRELAVLVEARSSVEGKVISSLQAHGGLNVNSAKTVDFVNFHNDDTKGLETHNVETRVHSKKNGNFGGCVGNYVTWEFTAPKAGDYILAVNVMAGGERKCCLSCEINGAKVQLPEISAPRAGKKQEFYLLNLPAGKVKFRWEATAGWSYIRGAKLIESNKSWLPKKDLREPGKILPQAAVSPKPDK
ncbi:MAG: heparinase II/III family protein [Phycisphaerae bacterium]|nr:heparinase II/III family protein [Phycisphaerae bacterium]